MRKLPGWRSILFFVSSALAFTALAASGFWERDFAHVLARIDKGGGHVIHGAHFAPGANRYTVLITGFAKQPPALDIDLELAGPSPMAHEILSSFPPTLDLGVHRWPPFGGDHLRLGKTGSFAEKLMLWLVLIPDETHTLDATTYHFKFTDHTDREVMSVPIAFGDAGHAARSRDEGRERVQQGGEDANP
jgi:hypothetical protein